MWSTSFECAIEFISVTRQTMCATEIANFVAHQTHMRHRNKVGITPNHWFQYFCGAHDKYATELRHFVAHQLECAI
jgi:hypothetical protein